MSDEAPHPALEALRARLTEEAEAYAAVLAAVDRLSAFALPAESAPEIRERLDQLNNLWEAPPRPEGGGLGGAFRERAWDAVAPFAERQTAFNAALVQLLNAYVGQAEALHARLRELAGALVRYAQRVEPVVDARDRVATALATTRSELLIEAFDRRLERLDRRLAGLAAARDTRDAAAPCLDLAAAGSDPLARLRSCPAGSVGVLHASDPGTDALDALLAEARRALRPGGLLLLESGRASSIRGDVEAAGFVVPEASSPPPESEAPGRPPIVVARR